MEWSEVSAGRAERDTAPTIFALASGAGRSAVAMVRISGGKSGELLDLLAGGRPSARRASLRSLRDPRTGEVIDQALVLWMPGPNSFSGEDVAELQLHGSRAVSAAVLRVLAEQPGCRLAEPGEFTRRAFLNGRMDLTAVEGLADLIDAETEAQRRQALRQMEGGLAERAQAWRERLANALAACEAALDFSDEDDVADATWQVAVGSAAAVAAEMRGVLTHADRGERLRDGFTVVLAGPVNAGKSSLLNAVAQRDVAIVSPIPGTTRDTLELRCDLGGLPVTFIDTAGLRDSQDEIERLGIERAEARMRSADLVLWLDPADAPAGPAPSTAQPVRIERVVTKSDLLDTVQVADLAISVRTGRNLDVLLDRVRQAAADAVGAGDALVTRERHRVALSEAAAALERVSDAAEAGAVELVAEDLRLALRALGRLVGRVDVEDVLDRIFAQFCIGK